ncbi:hypothetical protein D4S03_04350 [bacterium]|nr:MAG: hypothetical protein D4S03_04350 [bacterium]
MDLASLQIKISTSGHDESIRNIDRVKVAGTSAQSGMEGLSNVSFSSLVRQIAAVTAAIGGMYAAVRVFSAWKGLIEGGVGAVDDYRRSIISASAALTNLTDTRFQPDLATAYGAWKDYFTWLWTQSIAADKLVAASGREIFETAKELAKKGVVAYTQSQVEIAGRLTDFIKSVAPMTAGEGGSRNVMQIQQEIRSMLEGEVRMGAQVAMQFQVIDPLFKEHMNTARQTGKVYEYLNTLLEGQKQATKDMANTWESVSSTLRSLWQQIQIRAFSGAYDDVVAFGQKLISTLIEGGALTANGAKLADALGTAWSTAKTKVTDLLDYVINHSDEVAAKVSLIATSLGTVANAAIWATIKFAEMIDKASAINDKLSIRIPTAKENRSLGENVAANFIDAANPINLISGLVSKIGSDLDYAWGVSKNINNSFVDWANANITKPFNEATTVLQGIDNIINRIVKILNTPISWNVAVNLVASWFGNVPQASPASEFQGYETPGEGLRLPWNVKAPKTPPTRPFTGKPEKGGAGAENRMTSIIDTLDKELAKLAEGKLSEVEAWLKKMLNDIDKITAKGVDGTLAMSKARAVAVAKDQKIYDDFNKWYSKEIGDQYGELAYEEAEHLKNIMYTDDMTYEQKVKSYEAQLKVVQVYNKKYADIELERSSTMLNSQKEALSAMSSASPYLSYQLQYNQ